MPHHQFWELFHETTASCPLYRSIRKCNSEVRPLPPSQDIAWTFDFSNFCSFFICQNSSPFLEFSIFFQSVFSNERYTEGISKEPSTDLFCSLFVEKNSFVQKLRWKSAMIWRKRNRGAHHFWKSQKFSNRFVSNERYIQADQRTLSDSFSYRSNQLIFDSQSNNQVECEFSFTSLLVKLK